ncbi:pre-mRNA-splicing factor ISY1 [Cryptococcus deuterogattii 99/473]|uniref:Unplaced genomic scaffold supercont1.2, whole genome shotgun sequence n=1 Tax=Cryptococcus deuterogattii Ram5 TaxID=1296110 RepID=A0A0D0V699_9TREE|nr:pre-mRNA-splicing factor ISY1 [Cryptococcus deuterogattii Ram5]KIY55487.1 pre-mRNA-splicing factor ISY1 [Cryptococcus deuterogattii 99/473]
MARNSEKAQSMLYRFREQQAIDMGIGTRQKGDRRPRMASSCTSLREAERWRGDILRDISRKVSKIQDVALTDYQVRDLNDEINQLFREKRAWENQIINLGGANYRRAAGVMTDDEGREVPGTRGYKYFGRAKELPGVKELFTRSTQQATEESARTASFQMFRHQGPDYYGDEDELDKELVDSEDAEAREAWEYQARKLTSSLGISDESLLPRYPISMSSKSPDPSVGPTQLQGNEEALPKSGEAVKGTGKSKRKSRGVNDLEDGVQKEQEEAKKSKTDTSFATNNVVEGQNIASETPVAAAQAQAAAFLGVLDAESLKFPTMPSKDEMAQVLLDVRKQALRDEYGVY